MAIKVFDGTDNTFSTNGEIVLNPTRAIVHKEDNGSFYLDLEAPLTQETKYVAPEEGSSATINGSGQIQNVDSTKESELVSLKGNTSQVQYTGNQLIDYTAFSKQTYITINGENITINNTSAKMIYATMNFTDYEAGAYSLKLVKSAYSGSDTLIYLQEDENNYSTYHCIVQTIGSSTTTAVQSKTFTDTLKRIMICVPSGASMTISLMMVKGTYTESNFPSYEPYVGGTASPNPNYPQNVNVVSGDNTIKVEGKNLLSSPFIQHSPKALRTGIFYIPSGTYTLSFNFDSPSGDQVSFYKVTNGTTTLESYGYSRKQHTATLSGGTYFLEIYKTGILLSDVSNIQLEKGSSATTYEPYIGNTYPIYLGVENLFDVSLSTANKYIGADGGLNNSTISSTSDYIKINPSTNYTISGYGTNNSFKCVAYYDSSKTFISSSTVTNANNTYTITTPSNASYLRFHYPTANANIVQIEKGSKANSYSEYGTAPIELCKIGTYQDYIYKDNGSWYLHKEIGKVVLNGVEGNWTLASSTSDYYEYQNYNVLTISSPSGYTFPLSNYFSDTTNNRVVANGKTLLIRVLASAGITTANDFKTWLSTHNTIVYYVLANPTTTEIDNSELVSELNAIELIGGLNNISLSSEYLTGPMEIKYNFVSGGETTAKYIDYLQANNILVANTPQGNQAFRIANVERTRSKIRLKANHIFYDSQNYVISDSYVVEKNCNQALDHLNDATDNESPFTMTSDITTLNSYRCVRKSLYEAIQVVLERWGGHLVRDNFDIKVMNSIGNDNGVVVRYGKNLKNISATYNWDAVATKLMPVGKDGLLLPEEYLYASVQYDIPYTKVISFDQNNIVEDDYADADAYQQALINDLRQKGMEYLASNSIPMVNYTLNANLERITDIGDTIEVIDERLGINLLTNLIAYEYNCILDKYTQVQFGNFTPKLQNLMETIASNTEKAIEENNGVIQITLENELTEATDRIWGVLGNSYVIYEGDKILVVDELPKENAHNVIMINSGGIGFSQTGINGTFQSAWTIDNTLNMENINVINLTADLIKGGILKLGSNLNQYGQIEIYNEANNLIAELNKNGFKMYGTDGSYVLMNTQVGFAGYDRNDNKIYWADGDAFHMKKSEVEEEITLCGKMRYIPIHLTDTYGVEHNGIGLVSVLGGGN